VSLPAEPPGAARAAGAGRLLVDLPNWVGDVVMALPATARMAAGRDPGTVTLHCRPAVAGLLEALFPGCAVVATPRRTGPVAAARRLTSGGGRFAVGVTFRHSPRAKLLLALAARRRYGSTGGGGRLLLSRAVAVDRGRHQVQDADPLLAILGLPPADPGWRPALPAELAAAGRSALARAGVAGRPVAGLAPAAAWGPSKRWPAERFGRLAVLLEEAGLAPVILAGPGEDEIAGEVAEAAGRKIPVVGPDLDVAGLFGVMAGLRVVVSNDSGPMHLAALAGAPVVGLFGPTDPRRTAPLGENHRVLSRDLDCAPCFEPVCPLGHQDCLRGIPPERVAAAALELAGV